MSTWANIDWARPWLAPWRDLGEPVAHAVCSGLPLHEALNRQQASPLPFIAQHELPGGIAYEDYIFQHQQCPVREGLHDFFNGLCWMRFPQTKQHLNRLQAAQIAAQGIGATRGPVRDAITVFDENAAVMQAPQPLWDALQARDWHHLFVTLRPLWAQAQVLLFGHALLEKLVLPRKAMVAHVYRIESAITIEANNGVNTAVMDDFLVKNLSTTVLATKPFLPLPVLGIPGWWADNQTPDFYDDPSVFRQSRSGISLLSMA